MVSGTKKLWSYNDGYKIEKLDDESPYPLDAFVKSRIACQQARRTNLRNTFMNRPLKDFLYAGTDCLDDALVETDDPLGINHMDIDEDLVTEIIAEVTELYSYSYTDEYGREWAWCTSSGNPLPPMETMTYYQERKDWKKTKTAINTNLARLSYKKTDVPEWAIMMDYEYHTTEGYFGAITTRADAIIPGALVPFADVGTWAGFPPTGTYIQHGFYPGVIPEDSDYRAYIKFGYTHPLLMTGPWEGLGWCGIETVTMAGRIYPLHLGIPCTWGDLRAVFTGFEPRFSLTGRCAIPEEQYDGPTDSRACEMTIHAETSEGVLDMVGPWGGAHPFDPSENTIYGDVVPDESSELTFDITGTITCLDDDPDIWSYNGIPEITDRGYSTLILEVDCGIDL